MKKIMFVGPVGVGKTTLTQRLKGMTVTYHKTQAMHFHDTIIDTPGEFLQHRQYYNALTVTAAEVDVIGLLASAVDAMHSFPQGFASLFTKPVIGIVTKVDLSPHAEAVERARRQLRDAGASRVFDIGLDDNDGLDALQAYLSGDN